MELKSNPDEDFISTLPMEMTCDGPLYQFRKYQNFWIPQVSLPAVLVMQRHFQARQDDVILASFPKSGTTWLKALACATLTRGRHRFDEHPLLTQNPHDCVPWMELSLAVKKNLAETIEAMPSPRLIHTHMPFSLLPESVRTSECRLIYVYREFKDVLISQWHFQNKVCAAAEADSAPLSKNFELYCKGVVAFGPPWEHVLEYWKESQRRPEKVLFLRYEEMLQDPVAVVKRLAEFMRCPFTVMEKDGGVPDEIARLCSFENLSNLEVNKTGKVDSSFLPLPYNSFFRKGGKGDWRNHLTDDMTQMLDGVIRDQLRGRGDELLMS